MPPTAKIVLLRGINLGAANRISMPALREALTEAGHGNVRSYVQSGNLVLDTELRDETLETSVQQLISQHFDLTIPVLARSVSELKEVVDANPFGDIADRDPKRFQVTFLSSTPDADGVAQLERLADEHGEQFAARGRAIYAWHSGGIHTSKLAARMTPKRLGVEQASARNWTTVTTLLEMATS